MAKTKVLLIHQNLREYRTDVYNVLAEHIDLTVAYNRKDMTCTPCRFAKIKLPDHRFKSLSFFGRDFYNVCRGYDVIIVDPDLHIPQAILMPWVLRSKKIISWGIGFRASYTRPYVPTRRHTLLDLVYRIALSGYSANVFYMDNARQFWKDTSLDLSKCFTAINTVPVEPSAIEKEKKSILFVGTLYRGKGVDTLISAYAEAVAGQHPDTDITLDIVGDGEMRGELEKYAAEKGISEKVTFHGAIYDEAKLAELFAGALVCVSPHQAGLTVPKSMGYGVPVMTRRDAITGGEIYHIRHGETGLMYHDDSELVSILANVMDEPEKYEAMGRAAKDYYYNHATSRHQAQGVLDAIDYALTH